MPLAFDSEEIVKGFRKLEHECLILYTKRQWQQSFSSEKEDCLMFLPYIVGHLGHVASNIAIKVVLLTHGGKLR